MYKIMTGIDVSSHQKDIDWGVVKNSIDFAIIRAGFGRNNIDSKAVKNVEGCEQNGIPFGLYWFSYALSVDEARKEAQYLLQFAKAHTPLFPLYFDFEYDSVNYANKNGVAITPELVREMATAFCEELENAGYYAGIYANGDYIKRMYGEEIFKKYDLWYAQWGVTKANRNVHLWQFTDSGYVDGIGGVVDLNIAYLDYPALIKEKHLNGYKPEPEFVCPHGCPHCSYSKQV